MTVCFIVKTSMFLKLLTPYLLQFIGTLTILKEVAPEFVLQVEGSHLLPLQVEGSHFSP